MTKQQYIRNQQIIQNRLVKLYVPKVEAALMSQISNVIDAVKANGVSMAAATVHGAVLNEEIGDVIKDLYKTAANLAIRKYKPNMKAAFGFNLQFVSDVLDYLSKFLLNKVVLPISKTTVAFIDSVLSQAIAEGWGVDETVKRLEDTDLLKKRARVIVRTETVRATNFTQLAAADSEDWEMEKQWIAVDDKRTRLTHSNHGGVDGQRIGLYEKFSNGLMFPGDPDAPASEVCNCRCTLGYFAARDLNGRLIPKKNKAINLQTVMNINRAA